MKFAVSYVVGVLMKPFVLMEPRMGIWSNQQDLSLNSLTKEAWEMGDKLISFRDENGNFVSAADVWNAEKLEELFTRLNPNPGDWKEKELKRRIK